MAFRIKDLKDSLPTDEQNRLLKLIKETGDKKAKGKVIEHNLKLVAKIIHAYYYKYSDEQKEELFSVGSLGLCKALDNYDISLGYEFSTYAVTKITGEIRRFLRDNHPLHVPRPIQDLGTMILNIQKEYSLSHNNEELIPNQLSEILGVPVDDINLALNFNVAPQSLAEPVFDNDKGNSIYLSDTIEDKNSVIYQDIEQKELYDDLVKAMEKLTDREKIVIQALFKINGFKKTQIELAKELGLSQAQISRERMRALKKLKDFLPHYIHDEYEPKKINSAPKKSKQNVSTIYSKLDSYTKEDIDIALTKLEPEDRHLVLSRYPCDPSQKQPQTKEKFYDAIRILKKLKLIIIEQKYGIKYQGPESIIHKSLETLVKPIYSYFPSYSKEQVLEAINNLNDSNKKIIELRFGLNGNKPTSVKSIAETYNTEKQKIHTTIANAKKRIATILEQNKKSTKNEIKQERKNPEVKIELIFKLYPNYSEEQILTAINSLSDFNKKVVELRFGLNGNNHTEVREIARILNTQEANIYSSISYSKKRIAHLLENPKKEKENTKIIKENKKSNIFELYPNYSEEQILTAINNLNDINKKVVELRFGLNGNNHTEVREIARILNIQESAVYSSISYSRKRIAHLLENPKKEKETNKEIKKTRYQTLFEFFPDYSEEQVLKVLNSLSDDNIRIMELKFGLNGNEPTKNKEIAKILNLDYNYVPAKLNYVKRMIEKKLKERKFNYVVRTRTEVKIAPNSTQNETFEDKIKEIKNLILSNNFHTNSTSYLIDGIKVEVGTHETECLLTYKDNKRNDLDRPHSIRKNCFVYIISATDSNGKRISESVLVKDKQKNIFYKFVNRYKNGTYELSNVLNRELVCFSLGKLSVAPLENEETIEEKNKLQIDDKRVIIHPAFTEDEKTMQTDMSTENYNAGVLYFKDRKFIQAEQEFLKALASNKKYILQKSNFYLGKIYLAKNKPLIAQKYLEESLNINNSDYESLFEMGKALSRQEQFEKAQEYFDKCLKLKPNDAYVMLEIGTNYERQGYYEKAISQYDAVIKMKPSSYFAHFKKGNVLFNLGKLSEARKELNICNSLNTNLYKHLTLLGKINYLEGNTKKAEDLFEDVINSDLKNNAIMQIINIGYFFHQQNKKELAYKYYSKASIFRKWINLSDEEAIQHIKNHTNNEQHESMHSVFNFPVSMELLNNLIKDMEKTTTREMYDVYQIHCKDAGYMVIDEETTKPEDYITILTLPFTKKIMQSYPDFKLPNVEIKKTVNIEDLTSKTSTPTQQETPEIEILTIEENTESEETVVKPTESVEGTIIVDKEKINDDQPFEDNKDKFKMLINMLDDPKEQMVLLLRLGFVQNKNYTKAEIGKFLGMNEKEVQNITEKALANIHILASLTSKSIEQAEQQLKLT